MGRRIGRGLAWGAALALGLAAPGIAQADTSPAVNEPPMTAWVWFESAHEVTFDFSGSMVALPFPVGNAPGAPPGGYATIDQGWSGVDNPAPLLWYAQHVGPDAGQVFFAAGVKYSPQLIQTMNAEHFAPSMIGGVNPPGITAGSTASPPPAGTGSDTATSAQSGSGSATPSAGQTAHAGSTLPQPVPAPTHAQAPAAADHGSGSTTSRPASPPASTSVSPPRPAYPAAATHGPSMRQYRRIIAADEARLHPQRPAAADHPWAAWAGGGAVAVLGGAAAWFLRRRLGL